jgi:uncharacterized protein (DUF1800 family)
LAQFIRSNGMLDTMGQIDTRAAVTRLLRRTGFGIRVADVDAAEQNGLPATVDQVLAGGPDPGAAGTPPPHLVDPAQPDDDDHDGKHTYQKQQLAQGEQLVLWWLDRMTAATRPWVEKRTLLWHGHWATSIRKVRSAAMMLQQNQTLRQLGGGDFQTMARALAVDPALLVYLDASGSTAHAPNENLARELMEVFTLGVGQYAETDVRQAARALTGWRVDTVPPPATATFVPKSHAGGNQTILGKTMPFAVNDVVDLLVTSAASPRYLATRLWGALVSPVPPPAHSLSRAVAAYGPQRNLTALFRALLTDQAFTDSGSALVRTPVEWAVGALAALGLRPSRLPAASRRALLWGLQGLGQLPFAPPDVTGWAGGTGWQTAGAARARLDLAGVLARAANLAALKATATGERPDRIAAMLGLDGWTGRTRTVLAGAAGDPVELVTLALNAPEYLVS